MPTLTGDHFPDGRTGGTSSFVLGSLVADFG
jgi:hypothetical protein